MMEDIHLAREEFAKWSPKLYFTIDDIAKCNYRSYLLPGFRDLFDENDPAGPIVYDYIVIISISHSNLMALSALFDREYYVYRSLPAECGGFRSMKSYLKTAVHIANKDVIQMVIFAFFEIRRFYPAKWEFQIFFDRGTCRKEYKYFTLWCIPQYKYFYKTDQFIDGVFKKYFYTYEYFSEDRINCPNLYDLLKKVLLIQKLWRRILRKRLAKKISDMVTEYHFRPGNFGYLEAATHYSNLCKYQTLKVG